MPLRFGLVGMPNAGKTTLFNALTNAGAPVASYPFTTIDRHIGAAPIADSGLDAVARVARPDRVTYASLEVVDIAGLVAGASHGEGLGNQFLGHIREVDAVLHVLRCFDDPAISHVAGAVDPERDAAIVDIELALADLETLRRRRERIIPQLKSGERRWREEAAALDKLSTLVDGGLALRAADLDAEQRRLTAEIALLTAKPVLYVANVAEPAPLPDDPHVSAAAAVARAAGAPLVVVAARLEAEVLELDPVERAEYAAALGLADRGGDRLLGAARTLLNLITFYTANENEARAWIIPRATHAPAAAGRVHSDMERGFIAAEVVPARDLERAGSLAKARERGWLRLEGRDYEIQDGDLVYFRFNV